MNDVLISVNIVTYNRENTILRAIDSVLMQTYRQVEIIVVDDGSTDDTSIVLQKYKDVIKYFQLKKMGKSYCREFARTMSSGDYIALLDSDDCWRGDYLRESYQIIKKNNLDLLFNRCINHFYSLENEGNVILYSYSEIRKLIQRICPTPTSGMLLRSSLIEFKWNTDHNTYEDWHLQTRLVFLTPKIRVAYNPQILWEKHEDESTFKKRKSIIFLKQRLKATYALHTFLKREFAFRESLFSVYNIFKDSYRLTKSLLFIL